MPCLDAAASIVRRVRESWVKRDKGLAGDLLHGDAPRRGQTMLARHHGVKDLPTEGHHGEAIASTASNWRDPRSGMFERSTAIYTKPEVKLLFDSR
jgi:hypothetical protein